MRIVASIAALFATGRLPGRPRQTGQVWVLGSAPNAVGQPQNIFVRVPSSTCVSSPITGSYRAIASSYDSVMVDILLLLPCVSAAGAKGTARSSSGRLMGCRTALGVRSTRGPGDSGPLVTCLQLRWDGRRHHGFQGGGDPV